MQSQEEAPNGAGDSVLPGVEVSVVATGAASEQNKKQYDSHWGICVPKTQDT